MGTPEVPKQTKPLQEQPDTRTEGQVNQDLERALDAVYGTNNVKLGTPLKKPWDRWTY